MIKTTSVRLARWGVACLIALLTLGLFWGRSLQKEYPKLEQLLSIIGIILLLVIVAATILKLRRLITQGIKVDNIWQTVFTTIFVTATFVYLGTQLVVTAIEQIHLIKFGLLGFALFHSRSPQNSKNNRFIYAILIGSLIGGLDEGAQYFIPSRVFDLKDISLNLISVASGALLARNTLCSGEASENQR